MILVTKEYAYKSKFTKELKKILRIIVDVV